MKTTKQKLWKYPAPCNPETITTLSTKLHIPPPITTILLQRGIDNFNAARTLFNPSWDQTHNPFHMQDMEKAVTRIIQALTQQQPICIYGDYDVDGITSTTLLYTALKEIGANIHYYLPDRHKEGYGLSHTGITHCQQQNIQLIITIDCGIRAIGPIQQAKKANIDVIICDHHEPGNTLPEALAILNPKQKTCNYPFKELSGCGIGFKLLQALAQKNIIEKQKIHTYTDLVAISIAADIVPLTGENRILAHYGLKQLQQTSHPGLQLLIKKANHPNPYTISGIVFGIAPRINAPGRLSHAHNALQALLATHPDQAQEWITLLETENQQRKNLDQTLLQEALSLIHENNLQQQHSLVLYAPHWHKGILGIVAARCVEHHHKPTILLTKQENHVVGSARSVPGYNIYETLQACHDLLTTYGGHAYAAGLTLPLENLSTFQQRFEQIVQQTITPEQQQPQQHIDVALDLNQINHRFYNIIQRMRPFGPGFRQPVFSTQPIIIHKHTIYQEKHIALQLTQHSSKTLWRAIGFNMAHLLPYISKQQPLAIAYTIEKNTYLRKTRYELHLKDLKPIS